jgi:3-oxoacyl-[acyl-carrier protein] reductase
MSRTILITGASSSFGEELISRLPNDVKIIAQSRNPLPKINSEGSRIINVISDFSNPGFMTDFDGEVNFDEINEVVHFAASPLRLQNFVSTTSDQLISDYQINFVSVFSLISKIISSRKQDSGPLTLVVMLTNMLQTPVKGESSYISSKFALLGLIKSLSVEYSANELRVNAVSPSFVETRFVDHFPKFIRESILKKHPMKRHCTVSEVVDTIEFLLSSKSSFINGQSISINGGEN